MDIAKEIRERVSALEACRQYGIEVSRSGFACCISHSEKTPSMRVWSGEGGFHCFGCGVGGDVIDFVKLLFHLPFQQACAKINTDFNLNLPIGKTVSRREQLEAERLRFLKQKEKEKEEKEARKQEDEYWRLYFRVRALERQQRDYAPKPSETAWHPLFVEALKELPIAKETLSEAYFRRFDNGRQQGY